MYTVGQRKISSCLHSHWCRAVLTCFWGPGPTELMGPLPPPFPSFPPLFPPLPSPTLSSLPLRSRPLKSS